VVNLATGQSIEAIAADVALCNRCVLAKTRRNTVPGVGVLLPLVLVVGEGPGADEDAQGEPFVGRAGQLLDKMLAAISLSRRTNCFIANIVKCRPPGNRDPAPDEETACFPFLERQIEALNPKLILAVGRIAAQWMLHTADPIGRIRGRWFTYRGIPLMATYHPSALLRNEDLKKPAWEDLKLFRSKLQEAVPNYGQRL
jgi:DNA polymerase